MFRPLRQCVAAFQRDNVRDRRRLRTRFLLNAFACLLYLGASMPFGVVVIAVASTFAWKWNGELIGLAIFIAVWVALLRWSRGHFLAAHSCFKDLCSAPAVVVGPVENMYAERAAELADSNKYYIVIGAERFEVTPREYDRLAPGELIAGSAPYSGQLRQAGHVPLAGKARLWPWHTIAIVPPRIGRVWAAVGGLLY